MERNRLIGTEQEWSVTVQPQASDGSLKPSGALDQATASTVIKEHIGQVATTLGGGTNVFLGNGARLYVDVGDHLEYATPEDTSINGTVANELASELIMYALLEQARESGTLPHYSLNRRIIDESGTTWGYHESYAVPSGAIRLTKDAVGLESMALLGMHLATRNIFTGAGALLKNGRYVLSQKAHSLSMDYSDGTTANKKGVVNLRNEQRADGNRWSRVHVTSGDPNMSPWATRLKLGSTSLVLRLYEHGITLPHLRHTENGLHKIAKVVADNQDLSRVVTLSDGNTIRPLDIQGELIKGCHELRERTALPDEELAILDEWEQAYTDASVNASLLADRTDWMGKLMLLKQHKKRHPELAWDSEEMRCMDRQWDNIGLHGIGIAMRDRVWRKYMPSSDLILSRTVNAPTTTRAFIRGQFVNHFAGDAAARADWSVLRINDRDSCQLKDPYANSNPAASKLMAKRKPNVTMAA